MGCNGMEWLDMLDSPYSSSMTTLTPMNEAAPAYDMHGYDMNHEMGHHQHYGGFMEYAPAPQLAQPAAALHPFTDNRELEAFAKNFRKCRKKLGISQAKVGKAIANLKLPGISTLSQTTICRFENLTLLENNLNILKPILQAWLEDAEAQAMNEQREPEIDVDSSELEAFVEHFKQRRIKLGFSQAEVGKAIGDLKLPGIVGPLSQCTICRFEGLMIAHKNMIRLRPILQAWLEEVERQTEINRHDPNATSELSAGKQKRKFTQIAATEKRTLEAYFAVEPLPSSAKITAIAEQLNLNRNVVRIWFCNQRQKQKRMKTVRVPTAVAVPDPYALLG